MIGCEDGGDLEQLPPLTRSQNTQSGCRRGEGGRVRAEHTGPRQPAGLAGGPSARAPSGALCAASLVCVTW